MPKAFLKRYTHDLTSDELGKLFTRETPEAYRFFAKGINTAELEGLPWYQKAVKYAQGFFPAFTMRLSPARRCQSRCSSFTSACRGHSSPMARCGCSPASC